MGSARCSTTATTRCADRMSSVLTTWAPARSAAATASRASTVPARTRPADWMRALNAASDGALILQGERGEADELAPALLAALEDALSERA